MTDISFSWNRLPRQAILDKPRLQDYLALLAESQPDAEAASDLKGRRYTYKQLLLRIERFQKALLTAGLHTGDRVAVLSPPHTDAWISFLAVAGLGGIWLGLNPRYTAEEIHRVCADAQPRFIFTRSRLGERNYEAEFSSLRGELPGIEAVYSLETHEDGRLRSIDSFLDLGDGFLSEKLTAWRNAVKPENPCLLVYTSGSTGQPKGALLRQSGLVACSRVQAHHYGTQPLRSLNALPINHVGSICDTCTTVLVCGGCLVFAESFDPAQLLGAFGEERINLWGGVPTMFHLLLSHPAAAAADYGHLRRILWSGSPMPMPLAQRLASFGLPMHNFYGMTEITGSICFTDPDASLNTLVNSIGKPESSYEVRIADTTSGQICLTGEVGEIQTRSPGVLHSYWHQPAATAAAFTPDGWFRTGDLALELADGNYQLKGRLSDMFKSGGYNVHPREVEEVLEEHPAVAVACVVARLDPIYHEVGHAYVLPVRDAQLILADIEAHVRTRLANYKVPKRFEIVSEMPLLAVGKVDRAQLKRMAAASGLQEPE